MIDLLAIAHAHTKAIAALDAAGEMGAAETLRAHGGEVLRLARIAIKLAPDNHHVEAAVPTPAKIETAAVVRNARNHG